jgi:hypothetical protein
MTPPAPQNGGTHVDDCELCVQALPGHANYGAHDGEWLCLCNFLRILHLYGVAHPKVGQGGAKASQLHKRALYAVPPHGRHDLAGALELPLALLTPLLYQGARNTEKGAAGRRSSGRRWRLHRGRSGRSRWGAL